jgi:hypothetical protein
MTDAIKGSVLIPWLDADKLALGQKIKVTTDHQTRVVKLIGNRRTPDGFVVIRFARQDG